MIDTDSLQERAEKQFGTSSKHNAPMYCPKMSELCQIILTNPSWNGSNIALVPIDEQAGSVGIVIKDKPGYIMTDVAGLDITKRFDYVNWFNESLLGVDRKAAAKIVCSTMFFESSEPGL